MLIKSAEFIKSAVKPSGYPPVDLPEIAFAGRSNVGKSSLINTLVNRKRLVKTSSTPGRTQLLNFFKINQALVFVDLPGFGYAKAPATVKKNWGPMVETFLTHRTTLKGVVLIMDIRRSPRDEEFNLLNYLRYYQIPMLPVLTKIDKFSKNKMKKALNRITVELSMPADDLILFSAKTCAGKKDVLQAIDYLL